MGSSEDHEIDRLPGDAKNLVSDKPSAYYLLPAEDGLPEKKIPHAIHLNEQTGNWFYIDERDQIKYEYDPRTKAWFPMYDEDLITSQQSIYGTNEPEELALPVKRSATKKIGPKEHVEKKPKTRINSSVYVTGLPYDVTIDELKETFGKFGLLMEDLSTGDALITYFKEESVDLAVSLLDESRLRYDQPDLIYVQKADFSKKENTGKDDTEEKRPKLDPKLAKVRLNRMEKKLDWFENNPNKQAEKFQKIVLLKNMFTLAELDEDPALILVLKEDIRSECEKIGEVTNVVLYDKSEEGACTVRFKETISAQACVKLLNGRFFAGQRIIATIYDGSKYAKSSTRSSTDGDEAAEAARLEKYANWLEEQGGDP